MNIFLSILPAKYPMCHPSNAQIAAYWPSAFFTSATVTFCSPKCNIYFGIKPIGMAADINFGEGFAVLKRKFFSASKPYTGTFISLIASIKRKNQLFFNTSAPFNASVLLILRRYKVGMQVLQLINKCFFHRHVAMNNHQLVSLRQQ